MFIAQAIAVFFGVLVTIKSYDEFRHRREPLIMFLFWTGLWIGVVFIALFPHIALKLSTKIFGADAGFGTLFGIVTVFGLFLAYRLYIKAERAERRINKLLTLVTTKDVQNKQ